MATPEKKAKEEVKRALESLGCTEHFAPKGGAFGAIGVSDRVACLHGRYVAIECKADKNKLSPMQAHRLRNTALNGGIAIAYWADNYERLLGTLKYLQSDTVIEDHPLFFIVHEDYSGFINDSVKNKFVKVTKDVI